MKKTVLILACIAAIFMGCKTMKNEPIATTAPIEEDGISINREAYTLKKGESVELKMLTNASLGM
ncbi:MAG: hypothetical protein LBV46_00935, partial [Bacteroidales bacterium]|nr:hypothetical protein [Bacteroidales bacterium]